jgi:heme-degrading monooxygenase HmoA
MTTLLINHRVADYEAWRPHFDRAMDAEWTSSIRSYQVWRGQDDPNLVIVVQTFDSREAAEAFSANSDLREAMGNAGVDASSVQLSYFDEVGSGTR